MDPPYHPEQSYRHHRASPGFWEPPPPPSIPYPHWAEPPHYWSYHGSSREELRLLDYHRRQMDAYRYGSNGTLSASQELYNNGNGCCNRYAPPPQPPPCCSCEHRSWNGNQVREGVSYITNKCCLVAFVFT